MGSSRKKPRSHLGKDQEIYSFVIEHGMKMNLVDFAIEIHVILEKTVILTFSHIGIKIEKVRIISY